MAKPAPVSLPTSAAAHERFIVIETRLFLGGFFHYKELIGLRVYTDKMLQSTMRFTGKKLSANELLPIQRDISTLRDQRGREMARDTHKWLVLLSEPSYKSAAEDVTRWEILVETAVALDSETKDGYVAIPDQRNHDLSITYKIEKRRKTLFGSNEMFRKSMNKTETDKRLNAAATAAEEAIATEVLRKSAESVSRAKTTETPFPMFGTSEMALADTTRVRTADIAKLALSLRTFQPQRFPITSLAFGPANPFPTPVTALTTSAAQRIAVASNIGASVASMASAASASASILASSSVPIVYPNPHHRPLHAASSNAHPHPRTSAAIAALATSSVPRTNGPTPAEKDAAAIATMQYYASHQTQQQQQRRRG